MGEYCLCKKATLKGNKAKEIKDGYKMLYLGKTSGRNRMDVILDESMKQM